ncbi:hypothetical protein BME24068_01130 [Burkholderia metallica]|nr:hypothetical protein BME24068_01130 [Burkholderia metallica]
MQHTPAGFENCRRAGGVATLLKDFEVPGMFTGITVYMRLMAVIPGPLHRWVESAPVIGHSTQRNDRKPLSLVELDQVLEDQSTPAFPARMHK